MNSKMKKIIAFAAIIVVTMVIVLCVFVSNGKDISSIQVLADGDENMAAGLQVLDLKSYSGPFCEDGSDEDVKNVAQLTIVNNGENQYEYFRLQITDASGSSYIFSISTLLPGDTMTVLDTNRAKYESSFNAKSINIDNVVLFENSPSTHPEKIALLASDGLIKVSNVSDEHFDTVRVCYKNYDGETICGGITYRVTINDLNPGETKEISTEHYLADSSRFVFVSFE